MIDRKTVLIVEQDRTVSDLLKFLIKKRFGIAVSSCSKEDAFKIAMGSEPDIVIIQFDLHLDGAVDQAGLQVLRNLKANFPHLPILLFSEQLNFVDELVKLECEADYYIERSDDDFYEMVIQRVRKALRLQNGSDYKGLRKAGPAAARLKAAIASFGWS